MSIVSKAVLFTVAVSAFAFAMPNTASANDCAQCCTDCEWPVCIILTTFGYGDCFTPDEETCVYGGCCHCGPACGSSCASNFMLDGSFSPPMRFVAPAQTRLFASAPTPPAIGSDGLVRRACDGIVISRSYNSIALQRLRHKSRTLIV